MTPSQGEGQPKGSGRAVIRDTLAAVSRQLNGVQETLASVRRRLTRTPSDPSRATFNEVLLHELQALRPDEPAFAAATAASLDDNDTQREDNLRDIYRLIADLTPPPCDGQDASKPSRGLTALCLSGGGIRSATFNLGVLQALAGAGLLGEIDYLSSVSGGGYIAGWLRAWMYRDGADNVIKALEATVAKQQQKGPPLSPLEPEPPAIVQLREYSNYLTPRVGLFSADTWAAAAIIVRNLLLNWLVIIPMLAVVVTIPQICLLVLEGPHWVAALDYLVAASLLAGLWASVAVYRARRSENWKRQGIRQFWVVITAVVPLWISSLLLAVAAMWLPWTGPFSRLFYSAFGLWVFVALWSIVLPLIGWALTEIPWRRRCGFAPPWIEGIALIISGTVSAGILAILYYNVRDRLAALPVLYVMFAVPILLGVYLLARVLFVAIASLEEMDSSTFLERDDADREWWARLSGWVLIFMLGWIAFSAVCLLGDWLWQLLASTASDEALVAQATKYFSAIGAVAGVVAGLLGKSGDTASGRGTASVTTSRWKQWAVAAAAPVFCICLLILLAHATTLLGRLVTGQNALLAIPPDLSRGPVQTSDIRWSDLLWFLTIPLGALAISLPMGAVVNVNRFSLHGLYRNRLVRAYLGASNSCRTPDPFTGFDLNDNLPLHALWKTGPNPATRPLPVINVCMNLVKGHDKLAWQQRKGESFSMTPFYCGNFREGYRPSNAYGGIITLGTAVTISGAAANPNMGYHSSSAVMFVMGLFNARLGAWLGNVNEHGRKTYTKRGPENALRPLFAELFGSKTARRTYVNLSDGGHFDNLGLYEMVLRRCRTILVSDAGCDLSADFVDLGNAIRKIRTDFGIPIEFTNQILISPREETPKALYCATATIRYDVVDRGTPPGQLVYIKPALFGCGDNRVPYDIYSYSRSSEKFPHESTADQWFSEAQFESYRALGMHAIEQITQGNRFGNFTVFLKRVKAYIDGVKAPAET